MPTIAERPLPLRIRPDLIVQPLEFGGRRYFGVKDPLTLRYFQLREEEHAVLQMLDGKSSSETIRKQFERRFAPARLSGAQLQSFVGMLHEEGLVLSETIGQSGSLQDRGDRSRRKQLWQSLSNLLAIRFRGFDPEPFLNWLEPRTRWLYSGWTLAAAAMLVLSALTLIAIQFETLQARLPDLQAFFGLRNLALMAVTLTAVKILHELGHALTCRYFGGECHEMGIMLLVFTPALYCNVSDAWMLPGKWRRVAISGAGMVVEMVLAALCTWLWWFSEPGMLNNLCLNVMFVGSINTVVFNGNPLLRYDGYYILSDVIEIPNLREQAAAVQRQWLGKWFLGVNLVHERMLVPQGHAFLFLFGIASTVYRWVVLIGILWVLHLILKQYQLEVLAQWAAVFIVGMQLVGGARTTAKLLSPHVTRRRIHWRRFVVRGGFVAVLIAATLFVPLPYPLSAPVVLQPENSRRVYVQAPGRLSWAVREGRSVKSGDLLAELTNREVTFEVTKLQGERDRLQLRLEQLRLRQADPEASAQIGVTRESLQDVTERLAQRELDLARLKISAPAAGLVLAPRLHRERQTPGSLPRWSGDPLDERNRGAELQAGSMLCLIGNPEKLEGLLIIDQGDVDLIRRGQRVRLHVDEYPGQVLIGTVTDMASVELESAPPELAVQGDLPTRVDKRGVTRPRSTSYQARVALDGHPKLLTTNASGWGTISVDPQPLAVHLFRYLSRTFRFESAST